MTEILILSHLLPKQGPTFVFAILVNANSFSQFFRPNTYSLAWFHFPISISNPLANPLNSDTIYPDSFYIPRHYLVQTTNILHLDHCYSSLSNCIRENFGWKIQNINSYIWNEKATANPKALKTKSSHSQKRWIPEEEHCIICWSKSTYSSTKYKKRLKFKS